MMSTRGWPIRAHCSALAAVVLWFDVADFYHQSFFDRGSVVLVDNQGGLF